MADQIQNVKIRYSIEGVSGAKTQLAGLSKEEKEAVDQFKKLNTESKKANDTIQKETNKTSNVLKSVGGVIAGVFAVSQIVDFTKKVVAITAEFQKFEAVLTNSLGSNSAAQRAMLSIQEFAAQTPFAVAELTDSFVKLANQGFRPTNDELRKLGDLASSTGKSFDQLTEAVIDAQTGEFERLKEFGIRAQKEGDQVKFTFKGVEQQVDFTNDSIRDYILSLGDLEGVSGSMAAISQTLGGQISNLGDSFDRLFLAVGDNTDSIFGGAISLINDYVNVLANALTSTDKLIKQALNKDFVEYYEQQLSQFNSVTADAAKEQYANSVNGLKELLGEAKKQLDDFNKENKGGFLGTGVLGSVFSRTPEEEKEFQKLTKDVVYFQGLLDSLGDAYNDYNKTQETTKEVTKLTSDQIEKQFQLRLKELDQLEKLAVRRGQLENKSEAEIIDIKLDYNDRKLNLIKEYGKQSEFIFKDLSLKERELEREKQETLLDISRQYAKDYADAMIDRDKQIEEARKESLDRSRQHAKEYSDAMVQQDKEAAEKRKHIQQQAYNTFAEIANAFFAIQQNQIAADLESVSSARQSELRNFTEDKEAQASINAKYDKKERALKREAAITERNNALFNIALSTAQAIAKANPVIPLMILAGATGAAQAAVVASKPIPKYNKGTKSVPGAGNQDTVHAMLTPGEAVIPAGKNKEYSPAISAIFDGKIPANAMNSFALDYSRLGGKIGKDSPDGTYNELRAINKTLKGLKTSNISLDKNGFNTFISNGNSRTTMANNYFNN